MTISIYEKLSSIQKDIKCVEDYLKEYAKDYSTIKSLDEMVIDIQNEYERFVKRNDILEAINRNPEFNLRQKQIYIHGERKRVIVYKNTYTFIK